MMVKFINAIREIYQTAKKYISKQKLEMFRITLCVILNLIF